MKLCDKCIVQVEDNVAVCEECRTFVAPKPVDWKTKEEELKELIGHYKGKGKYDVLVPFTGGKDSSYVLWYAKKVLKVRPLAFTWQNYLSPPGALANMENVTKKLGVEHRVFELDEDTTKRIYRAQFKNMGRMCYCLVWARLFAIPICVEEGIPLALMGESAGQREGNQNWEIPTNEEIRSEVKNFYKISRMGVWGALRGFDKPILSKVMEEMFGPLEKCLAQKDVQWPIYLPLSNYVNWLQDRDELMRILQEECGWKKPGELFSHTSCTLEPIKGYMEYRKGLHETAAEICCNIRMGTMTRKESIEEMKQLYLDGTRPDEKIASFCKVIGITEEEFDKNIGKTHVFDNPLAKWIFNMMFAKKIARYGNWLWGVKSGKFTIAGLVRK